MIRLLLVFSLCCLLPLDGTAQDAAKDLRSKEVSTRLAAIENLVTSADPGAEKLLLKALKDKDWEVVERAAEALATLGGKSSVKPLVTLALEGPVRRLRLTAARSLAEINPAEAIKAVDKKLRGKTEVQACEALTRIAAKLPGASDQRKLEKLLSSKEMHTRMAAAEALIVSAAADSPEVLTELLQETQPIAVTAAALDGARSLGKGTFLATLGDLYSRKTLTGVLERRAAEAIAACILTNEDEEARKQEAAAQLGRFCAANEGQVAERGTRLGLVFVRTGLLEGKALHEALGPALEHPQIGVRAGALRALEESPCPEAKQYALGVLSSTEEARVRLAALRLVLTEDAVEEEEIRAKLKQLLLEDASPFVREGIAVALAVQGHEDVVGPLVNALEDTSWGVAACAAVSLGRSRQKAAVAPLARVAREAKDWRLRGAAVVGLTQVLDKEAIPVLIEVLEDEEQTIVRTSLGYLRAVARQDLAPEMQVWKKWWEENEKHTRLWDPKEVEERRKKYGYNAPAANIYLGIDVLVLESRGDHIQFLLDFLGIKHRLTESAQIATSGVDARGVFVSNCTGEIVPNDVEQLAWFVRVGGSLFGSCWALHETIEPLGTGAVRKLETRNEVLDNVLATPCAIGSPYLEGVFGPEVRPIYALQGAHLIEVLEAERVEVLVDSAECAENWGGGELACWFRLGHGVVLDSVNHFDVQGLELATGLKKPEQRMAYAMDHMGLTYVELRLNKKAKYWSSNARAAREVRDLSVFQLVTNFVRLRRMRGL